MSEFFRSIGMKNFAGVSAETKIIVIPTKSLRVVLPGREIADGIRKKVVVKIDEYGGYVMGYNAEHDVLVVSGERRR